MHPLIILRWQYQIQYTYSKLMAKKANKHADQINYKANAGKIKPYSRAVTNSWSFQAKAILKAISMHSAETIKGTMRLPFYIGLCRKIRVKLANSMKADVYSVDAPSDGKQDPRKNYDSFKYRGVTHILFCCQKLNVNERAKSAHSRIFMPN